MTDKKPQIIATIGPSSKTKEMISNLIDSGMTYARLNFSWGTYDEHAKFIASIREAAKNKGVTIPIIQDLSGPRIQDDEGHHFNESSIKVITEKDEKDIEFGAKQQIEYVALSYVGDVNDIKELREKCAKLNFHPKIVAKIERQKAVDNIDSIAKEADMIMVARGDLGDAVSLPKLPFVQKEVIKKVKALEKPVIVATEFLTSVIDDPIPSRADISDMANAILDGADILMLSNETAVGEFPNEAVNLMYKVITEALKNVDEFKCLNCDRCK